MSHGSIRVATSGRPAFAEDYATGGSAGDVLKRVAGIGGAPDDVEWGTGGGGGGFPAPATSHIIFTSPLFGNDTTGDGTMVKPYATYAKALSVLVAPSITNVWEIVMLPGEYSENIALHAFVRTMGFDTSASQASVQSVRLAGNITLGMGWSADLAFAALSNIFIDGDVTLDYPTATSATGSVSFTNCNTSGATLITQDVGNTTEYYACTVQGTLTTTGGTVNCVGTAGTSSASQLRVAGHAGTPTLFQASGGGWLGDLFADQNAITDQTVTLNLNGFSIAKSIRITAAGPEVPVINAAHGAILENPLLAGSSAKALSQQMRVSQSFIVASGTVIDAAGTTDVKITLADTVLGATSIEDMNCSCSLIGTDWVGFATTDKWAISWAFVFNAGANEIHCLIYNPGLAVTLPVSLSFKFFAYLPYIPFVP